MSNEVFSDSRSEKVNNLLSCKKNQCKRTGCEGEDYGCSNSRYSNGFRFLRIFL